MSQNSVSQMPVGLGEVWRRRTSWRQSRPRIQSSELRVAFDTISLRSGLGGRLQAVARKAPSPKLSEPLWPDQHGGARIERGVALVLQSGNIAVNLTMQARGLPLAYVVAVGNKAKGDFADDVEAFLDDERVTAIGLHIEGLNDVEAFDRAAGRARELRKAIVAIKTGRSEAGAALTLSHTASLAGPDALYDAF